MRGIAEGLVMLLIGAATVWGASLVPPAPAGETWAGGLPMGAALLLMLSGGWLTYGGWRAGAEDAAAVPTGSRRAVFDVLLLIVVALAYPSAITRFGYEAPTAVAAPLALWIFGVRRPLSLALAAVLCPLVFHLIFFRLLGVFPPRGEIFDLVEAVGG